MMPNNAKSNRLIAWLESRFTEAQLSADEVREFSKWLVDRSGNGVGPAMPQKKNYTMGEVREFINWIQSRMRQTSLTADERKQFHTWFVSKLDALDENELDEIKNKLQE
jgi:hypothetical protein